MKAQFRLDLSNLKGRFTVKYINTSDGTLMQKEINVEAGKKVTITLPADAGIVWLTK